MSCGLKTQESYNNSALWTTCSVAGTSTSIFPPISFFGINPCPKISATGFPPNSSPARVSCLLFSTAFRVCFRRQSQNKSPANPAIAASVIPIPIPIDAPVESPDECLFEAEAVGDEDDVLLVPAPEVFMLSKPVEDVEEDCVEVGRDEDGSGFGEDWEVEEKLEEGALTEDVGVGVVPAAVVLEIA